MFQIALYHWPPELQQQLVILREMLLRSYLESALHFEYSLVLHSLLLPVLDLPMESLLLL
jgi:hypothetical protein